MDDEFVATGCLEAHVEALDAVGEGSEGDEIDSGQGIGQHIVEGDASAGLRFATTVYHLYGTASVLGGEVVEHDAVAPFGQGFVQLLPVADLALYLQVLAFFATIGLGTADGVVDSTAEVDVVVLEQDHVEEADTMVHTASDAYGFLFQHTHSGGRLAGIQDVCLGAGVDEGLLVFVRHGGYTAHALQDVQHQTFGLQKALNLSFNTHHDIAWFNVCSVFYENLYLHGGIETVEHLLGYLYPSKDAFLLYQQLTLAHLRFGDTAQGGMVAIAYVLGKGQVDQCVI